MTEPLVLELELVLVLGGGTVLVLLLLILVVLAGLEELMLFLIEDFLRAVGVVGVGGGGGISWYSYKGIRPFYVYCLSPIELRLQVPLILRERVVFHVLHCGIR